MFINKCSPFNVASNKMEDVIPSSCDFLKNISFTNPDDDDFEKKFFLDWDEQGWYNRKLQQLANWHREMHP